MQTVSIVIEGVERTTKALKQYDAVMYKEFVAEVKTEVEKAKALAQGSYVSGRAIRGWNTKPTMVPVKGARGFPNYNYSKARSGVKVIVGGKTGKSRKTWRIAALQTKDPGGVIYDMAGSKTDGTGSGISFIAKMRSNYGQASRVMWPSMNAFRPAIVSSIDKGMRKATTTLETMMFKDGRRR